MKKAIFYIVIMLLASSCFKEPDYSFTPEISFLSISNNPKTDIRGTDSVTLSIKFKDGDGDLGLNSRDTAGIYAIKTPNGSINKFYNNYFIRILKKQNGVFVPISFTDPSFTLDGRYPILNENGRKKALEGEIRYSFLFFYVFSSAYKPEIKAGDVIKFEIQIADRTLNVSNVVETAELIVGKTL
ncbi:MAG: hypothetical protein EAZ97_15490 [Bacteroidetes bacterium]|nr:MAG: hypothetical protein EAZ97_15490 [Bacteroidota bacterium]